MVTQEQERIAQIVFYSWLSGISFGFFV